MNLPALVCLAVVLVYPIAYAGYLSVHEVTLSQLRTGDFPWAGAANFTRLIGDEVFWLSLSHTAVFAAVSVGLEVLIALGIALIVDDERMWISRVTRALILLPWAVPPVVNGLLWSFVFNAQYGYLNRVLHAVGLIDGSVNWLGTPALAMAAVITAYVWRTTPFNVLLYHAALSGIPTELYEAAEVDGANAWYRFWRITLPLLTPVIVASVLLRVIGLVNAPDLMIILTHGGPGLATHVLSLLAFNNAYTGFDFGAAAAVATVMLVILMLFTSAYVRVSGVTRD